MNGIDQLATKGWAHLSGLTTEDYYGIADSLGSIINKADVTVRPNSKALTTSDKELGIHTDHHKARIAALLCIHQASEGGVTYLIDGRAALKKLNSETKAALRKVMLHEHRVFEDDPAEWPLLSGPEEEPSIYYSFWLVKEPSSVGQREAVREFHRALSIGPRKEVRLEPGEALFFQNNWFLHGRTKIEGDKNRLLKRVWIS